MEILISLYRAKIVDNLRSMPFAPSVQTQEVPRDFNLDDYVDGEDSEAEDADHRQTRKWEYQVGEKYTGFLIQLFFGGLYRTS